MGQESSHLVDPDTPPDTLSDRSLRAVAQLIKDGRAKQVVVMTGAGISTAAGIPDFRSPKTGLYHNLARLNLPHPEAVFEIDFFRSNPAPFYLLAKELYPGNFSPTVSHTFITLLAKKGLLRMLFTQNIDCLERAAGVPADRIIEAHGSFATQRCVDCRTPFPDDLMREYVKRGEAPRCTRREACGGLVKPDIVFFGEQLPETFHSNVAVPGLADLVLVMGTSLLVHPFAGLPCRAREGVPRVLFNLERVGDMGTRADDVLVLGDCDSGIRKLADELGWRDELEATWRGIVGEKEAERQLSKSRKEGAVQDELDELDELAGHVADKLGISEGSEGEPDTNIGKQGEGAAGPPHAPSGPPEGSTAGAAAADAAELVDDGPAGPAAVPQGKDERSALGKDQQEPEAEDDDKSALSYEPLKPTTEKPITQTRADAVKAEDEGGGGGNEKPAV